MNIGRVFLAGVVGGAVVDAFLIAMHAAPFPGIYQFIASTVVGPVAFTSSSYIALGLLMHFVISIVFAFAYAFVAERKTALVERPIVWGAIFGVAVMIVMQIVLALAHASLPPTAAGLALGLVSHIAFCGIPVAWIIAGRSRRAVAA